MYVLGAAGLMGFSFLGSPEQNRFLGFLRAKPVPMVLEFCSVLMGLTVEGRALGRHGELSTSIRFSRILVSWFVCICFKVFNVCKYPTRIMIQCHDGILYGSLVSYIVFQRLS